MIKAKTSQKVRFAETDAMGVVYHAKMSARGFHLPVVEAHVKYRRPAKFGDTVEIESAIVERPGVKIKIEYRITANSVLLAEAQTVHVFVNSEGLPVKPPREYADVLLKAFDENP